MSKRQTKKNSVSIQVLCVQQNTRGTGETTTAISPKKKQLTSATAPQSWILHGHVIRLLASAVEMSSRREARTFMFVFGDGRKEGRKEDMERERLEVVAEGEEREKVER